MLVYNESEPREEEKRQTAASPAAIDPDGITARPMVSIPLDPRRSLFA